MGDNNVASIGKMLMQTQGGQNVTAVDGADIGTTFRKMVDQMTQIPGSSVSTGSQTAQNMQQLTPHSPEQNYDRYQYQKNKIPEQSTKDWTAGSQVSEKLESFEESVRDVIKEELQVTDEQITEAMETLGLTVADLMNPQQLAALAAELTGTEDMGALLCNEAFMDVMQSVGTLTEDLLQELGVTAEELTQLLENAGQTDVDADLTQTVQTTDAGETDAADAQRVYADTEDGIRDTAEQPQAAAVAETEPRADRSKDITPEETDAQAKMADAGTEEETVADAAAGTDKEQAQTGSNSNSGQQNVASQAHAGVDVHTGPTLTETVTMQGANSVGEYAAQVDIADVVRQIVTYTRVNYTANQETTMEMQLNPEHLGKIYLEITSKDGTVSAHLTAQNEVVKEALESQIADLKQNMNQAGVKVDAVEVTVGGHEFEKNLEQNAKQEEQQAEKREKAANATRHINLNELDGLSGLMTEEETLVAKMMAEQGNSVDFTA
ncbi:flagellar hook-length control protein FliK [Roseburia hominis]|uniref:flagellar hook-length control protein FliK n=1 Tax=Roseburia hominis TaxID=301301 RepID=UPI0026ED2AF1|nr:flagellar hook-length control protein FliK [Roseburia hominis]MCI7524046.1 flagellar hook-length control protein FliK [Roseburia hominis]